MLVKYISIFIFSGNCMELLRRWHSTFRTPPPSQIKVKCWFNLSASGSAVDISGIKILLTCPLTTEKPYKIIARLTILAESIRILISFETGGSICPDSNINGTTLQFIPVNWENVATDTSISQILMKGLEVTHMCQQRYWTIINYLIF